MVIYSGILLDPITSNKKRCQGWTPLTKLSGSAHVVLVEESLARCCFAKLNAYSYIGYEQ